MTFRRAFSATSKWRHVLQQKRSMGNEASAGTQIVLGPHKKGLFEIGIVLIGAGIAGTMYYYVLRPRNYYPTHKIQKSNYVDESEAKSKLMVTRTTFGTTLDTQSVEINNKQIELDEKTIKSHLSAIGFAEFDVNLLLQEKIAKNQKLNISEILDELIENYKTNEKKLFKDGGNKQIKIKGQKTMFVEQATDNPSGFKSTQYVNKKYESCSFYGWEEKEMKIVTQLEVESSILNRMKTEEAAHYLHTAIFASFAGLSCILAFNKRCRFRHDIFLSPIEKKNRFFSIFSAAVGSVTKGAIRTIPLFAVLSIATNEPWGPRVDYYAPNYRDGYMETLPASPIFPDDKGARLKICNSYLNYVKDRDNIMECTTSLAIVHTDNVHTFSPITTPPSPLAPIGYAMFCAFATAFIYPFTILPASCVGGVVLATVLMF